MAAAPTNHADDAAPRFLDDVQLDWDEFPSTWQRWLGLSRWVVLANCIAVCVLIWWLALNLARTSSERFPAGSTSDLALAGLVLIVAVAASALVVRLHSIGGSSLSRNNVGLPGADVAQHRPDVDWQTGLASRSALERRLTDALTATGEARTPAVVLCEVSRLGRIRDSLGYRAGDEAMRRASERVSAMTVDQGFVARFDGSVLAIALDHVLSIRDVTLMANSVADCLDEPVTLSSGQAVSLAGSVGYAVAEPGDDPGQLISNARSALSQAVSSPRRAVARFDPSVRAAAVARLELEQDLRGALERGELEVHYQPVLDVTSGLFDRFEALIRWHHPAKGMVHPAEFLSVAADSNLMVGISSFVLRQAGQQAVQWSVGAGSPVTVSVNIDRQQLVGGNLPHEIAAILDEVGLPAEQLEIEFAERVLEQDVDEVVLALQQLSVLGVKLSVDDFGTSQASLVRLQRLSMVSTLKMDRVFVEGVDSGSVDRSIVEAIVKLAESLGLTVVAEGVETSSQASTLGELGVRLQQGFYHQRPGPAADMATLATGQVTVATADRPISTA